MLTFGMESFSLFLRSLKPLGQTHAHFGRFHSSSSVLVLDPPQAAA